MCEHSGQPKNDGVLIDWQCSSAGEHFACVLLHSAAAWPMCSYVYIQLIRSYCRRKLKFVRSAQVLRHLGVEIADARFMWQMEGADVLVYVPRNFSFQYCLI